MLSPRTSFKFKASPAVPRLLRSVPACDSGDGPSFLSRAGRSRLRMQFGSWVLLQSPQENLWCCRMLQSLLSKMALLTARPVRRLSRPKLTLCRSTTRGPVLPKPVSVQPASSTAPVTPCPPKVQSVVESRIVDAEKRLADQMQTMLKSVRQEFEEQSVKLRQDQSSQMQTSDRQTDVDVRIASWLITCKLRSKLCVRSLVNSVTACDRSKPPPASSLQRLPITFVRLSLKCC